MKTIDKAMLTGLAIAMASGLPATAQAQQRSAEDAAEWRMQNMDENEDGVVTLDEFQTYRTAWVAENGHPEQWASEQNTARAFGRMDGNSDGSVTMEEMVAHVTAQRERNS
ncbi:hypothetical protein [Aurantiacibacter sp. MUD61]|uniref:hypothetical protein n=1 Tax=Aurantiacibacter sp. MUD61 TaxID=3009083 RepID=UPI0022F0C664|nr:hypothetical protein [Aurantiacibacter sp. MUD61]